MGNSVDPDQTASEQSDQSLHGLLFHQSPSEAVLYGRIFSIRF